MYLGEKEGTYGEMLSTSTRINTDNYGTCLDTNTRALIDLSRLCHNPATKYWQNSQSQNAVSAVPRAISK